MADIQWVTISVSNNFFICQIILPRFLVDYWISNLFYSALSWKLTWWGFFRAMSLKMRYLDRWVFRILYVTDSRSRNVNNFVCVSESHAQRVRVRYHVHLWITFVFVSNTCVSLGITKTSPEDHGTLLAFHALRLRFTICILVYCTIARMSSFSGQCVNAWAGVLLYIILKVLKLIIYN